jgi:hypothetical protein
MAQSKHHRADQSASEWKKNSNKRKHHEHTSISLDEDSKQKQEENAARMKRAMNSSAIEGIFTETNNSWWAKFKQRITAK